MADNLKKYNNVFMKTFDVSEKELRNGFSIASTGNWDSVAHLNLVTVLEEEFDIMLDTEDIVDFDSYEKGKEILKKCGIEF